MRKTNTRWMALILCLLLCLPAMAMAEPGFNDPGTYPICQETVHLTVGVPDNIRIEDYETNVMTQKLEEWGNYDLEFVVFDSTDYVTKLNLMVMAGGAELPDVILFDTGNRRVTDNMLYSWAQSGAIIPLTAYYNDPSISYWLHEAVERTGVNFFSQITAPDGEIYAIPTYNQSYGNEYPAKMYYYEPWLKALNLAVPTTVEEYKDVLRAVVSSDPNGNGIADEIGLSGTNFTDTQFSTWFPFLMNSFVYAGDTNYFTVEDGTVGVAYNTDAWKEGLKFIRGMFEEGLIAVETLTQDQSQFTTLSNANPLVMFSAAGFSMSQIDANNPDRDLYTYLMPLEGPDGTQYASFAQSTALPTFVVSAGCENPEAAFRLGDLMVNEYFGIMQRYGEEGADWDYAGNVESLDGYVPYVEGFDIYFLPYDDDGFWGGSGVSNASYRQLGPYIRQYAIANGKAIHEDTVTGYMSATGAAGMAYQDSGMRPAETIPKLIYDTDESERVSEILVTLKSYVEEMTANFLVGNMDIDAGWDAYVSELENIGVSTLIDTVQVVYDRMYK